MGDKVEEEMVRDRDDSEEGDDSDYGGEGEASNQDSGEKTEASTIGDNNSEANEEVNMNKRPYDELGDGYDADIESPKKKRRMRGPRRKIMES
jgi:hypothetical protein